MNRIAILILALACGDMDAQTITAHCPPMRVDRVGFGLFLCAEEPCLVTLTWPGKTIKIAAKIPPTYARKSWRGTWVDQCVMSGTTDGNSVAITLPPEPVVFKRLGVRTAKAIDCEGELVLADGSRFTVKLRFDDTDVDLVGFGLRVARETTARGTITKEISK